jgi:hypothetical protein
MSRPAGAAWLAAIFAATAAIAGCSQGAASAAIPVLGRPAGDFAHGTGWGKVRPAEIFNGGDPTGLVTHIRWSGWGAGSITGTGISDWPYPSVAAGKQEPVKIVAFNLGTCAGKLMYKAVEWYFPQHGQAFKANQYENVCAGRYVGR